MKWSHLILLLLCGAVALPAQENEARFRAGFSVKAVIGIGYLKSGFGDLSVSGFLTKEIGDHLLVGHQISASLYSRGLGTSIFDDQNRRAQIDLVNSFFVAAGSRSDDPNVFYRPQLFNQRSACSFVHPFEHGAYLGTHFVVNNNRRNQQVGFFVFHLGDFEFLYYNDGFFPFENFLSDDYDRFWTGGGYLRYQFRDFSLQFNYDRFTEDFTNSYVLAKELFLFGVPNKDMEPVFFNRALTSLKVQLKNGYEIGGGVLGHWKYDVQDFLHNTLGFAKHISVAKPALLIYGGYDKFYHYNILENEQ